MRAALAAAVALWAGLAEAQCGNGAMNPDRPTCCVCDPGYKLGSDGLCTACAEGFLKSSTGKCTDGKAGSDCADALSPPFGCGARGTCSKSQDGRRSVFPCSCSDTKYDPASHCTALKRAAGALTPPATGPGSSWAECMPKGPRMYTTFPNTPIVEKPFSILIVGCDIGTTGNWIVIPASQNCSNVKASDISQDCTFSGSDVEKTITVTCKDGWMCDNCAVRSNTDQSEKGMSVVTLDKIVYLTKDALADSSKDGGWLRLCQPRLRLLASGETQTAYVELDNHNTLVNRRSDKFPISAAFTDRQISVRGAAVGEEGGGDGGVCCEGLKVGDACLPLVVFLLLWILMGALIAALLCMLHKNQKDIDAERNNLKFTNFGTDRELEDMAAEQQEDDDDI